MEILNFTVFFSVLLAIGFISLLVIANLKGWFSKLEQDSLSPLAKDAEPAQENANEAIKASKVNSSK